MNIKNFIEANKSVIAPVIFAGLTAFISAKFKIPVMTPANSNISFPDFTKGMTNMTVPYPTNSTEAAVASSVRTALTATWDSDKLKTARDVLSMLQGKEDISEETKTYAINTLSLLSEDMTWDSDRRKLSKILQEVSAL